jgi:hypothetical protein
MRACCPPLIPDTRRSWTLLQAPQRLFGMLCALLSLAALVAAVTGTIAAVAAPAGHGREDAAARAAYLYSFLSYIEWPARALPLTDSPLVIGVLNAEEVAAELLLSTLGRKTGNRSVTIRPLQPGDSMDNLHLLYIGPGEAQQVQDVIRHVPQRWTVTVTDDAGAGPDGLAGAINFRRGDGRLRFEVSQAAVERSEFKLSSRLMSVAIVQPGQN